jgi:glutaryl-CoA dehydrogenase
MAFGSEEQKARWVPLLAAGKAIGCFGLTEPDFGSNPAGMRTVAKRDGGDYVLCGRKMWITNGSVADFAIVWAKLESAESNEFRAFLVKRGSPGFKAFDIKEKFSLRASVTSELALEDVRVPAENMLPGTEIGLRAALMCLTQARYGIAWGAIGAANACYDEALRHAKGRVQFEGKPIAAHQLVQMKLVEIALEISKAQLLCLRLAKMKEEGALKHYHVSLAKMNNVEMARDAARSAREILGASGITYECQTGRHLCNMETVHTYEGTRDIHALIVGRELTGVSAIS